MMHKGLNELLCAALINECFREVLLRNPAQAIASGYYGHNFSLTAEERTMLVGIRAQRLEDLADQVYAWLSGKGSNGIQERTEYNHNGQNGRNGHSWNWDDLFDLPESKLEPVYAIPA